jgi:small GTP-binding protein
MGNNQNKNTTQNNSMVSKSEDIIDDCTIVRSDNIVSQSEDIIDDRTIVRSDNILPRSEDIIDDRTIVRSNNILPRSEDIIDDRTIVRSNIDIDNTITVNTLSPIFNNNRYNNCNDDIKINNNIIKINNNYIDIDINFNIDIEYKIVVLGDSNVGKTTICECLINNKFKHTYGKTVGINPYNWIPKQLNDSDRKIKVSIYDTAGYENYRLSNNDIIYRNIDVYLIVFDLSNIKSFDNIKEWYREIKEYNKSDKASNIFLIGNKSDIAADKSIHSSNINMYCSQYSIPYIEITAKNNIMVRELFQHVFTSINK